MTHMSTNTTDPTTPIEEADHDVMGNPDNAPLSAREIFTLVMFAVMIVGTAGCMVWLFLIR